MNKEELDEYVNKVNKINSNIQFTHEYGYDDKINFLDITLSKQTINDELKIKIIWFRKETISIRLLNYNFSHTKSIKTKQKNIMKNMITRIIETTKYSNKQQEDLKKLKDMSINSN